MKNENKLVKEVKELYMAYKAQHFRHGLYPHALNYAITVYKDNLVLVTNKYGELLPLSFPDIDMARQFKDMHRSKLEQIKHRLERW